MVGLDAAGKTTILYKLKLGEIVTTIPTIGMLLLFACPCPPGRCSPRVARCYAGASEPDPYVWRNCACETRADL